MKWELMPLALDQGLGTMVWSPLGWGRLTGKIRCGQPAGEGRIAAGGAVGGPPVDEEKLFAIVDVLEEIANERGKTIPQVALNWVLGRPSVANMADYGHSVTRTSMFDHSQLFALKYDSANHTYRKKSQFADKQSSGRQCYGTHIVHYL
jgi:diketogulonate reductase-like aldo/keto reductase